MELTEIQQHEIHCHGAYVGSKTEFYCENKAEIKPLLIFFLPWRHLMISCCYYLQSIVTVYKVITVQLHITGG